MSPLRCFCETAEPPCLFYDAPLGRDAWPICLTCGHARECHRRDPLDELEEEETHA